MPFFHPGENIQDGNRKNQWRPKRSNFFLVSVYEKKFVPRSLCSLHAYNCSFNSTYRGDRNRFFIFLLYHPRKKEKKKKRKVSSETETFHSRFRGFGWVVDKFVYLQHFSPRLADDVATSSLSLMGKPFGQRIDLIIAISAAARSSSRRREIST